jgi:alpha-glucosidase (family GH31 glycosyl hydrolase)
LIAPIFNDEGTVTVVFPPKNDWVYFFNNELVYEGNTEVNLTIPLNESGIFVRKGSLIGLRNRFIWYYPDDVNIKRTFYNSDFNDEIDLNYSEGNLRMNVCRYYK